MGILSQPYYSKNKIAMKTGCLKAFIVNYSIQPSRNQHPRKKEEVNPYQGVSPPAIFMEDGLGRDAGLDISSVSGLENNSVILESWQLLHGHSVAYS